MQTDGTYNYTYDAEGNTTQRTLIATGAVTDYGYTYKNWLASVTERASAGGAMTKRTEFIYDAFGQRVGKKVDSDGNGTWDRHEAYVWADGQEVLRLVDADGDGTAQPFRVANRYLYAGAVDELLADEQFTGNSGPAVNATTGNATAGNTLYPLTDHLGSVRDLMDNNGINRQHVVFDSFGRRTLEVDYNTSGTQIASNDPAAIDELFGYTGRDWDTDVGLQYNRARWYDPSTGRWMNQDPIGFAAGDTNLYRYVGNSPANSTDPSGFSKKGLDRLRELILKNLEGGHVVGIGDTRPSLWSERDGNGPFVSDSVVAAIDQIWETEGNRIYCEKYSAIVMLKSLIDLAREASANGHKAGDEVLSLIDELIKGMVIPEDVENLFYETIEQDTRKGPGYGPKDLQPGDQIWIHNPYYRKPQEGDPKQFGDGEEGSNLFYAGGGNVRGLYSGKERHITGYRKGMCNNDNWLSIKEHPEATYSDFQVRRIRRVLDPQVIVENLRKLRAERQVNQ